MDAIQAMSGADDRQFTFQPEPGSSRRRLDQFLAEDTDLELTRSQARRLIDGGHVDVGGVTAVKPGHRLAVGDRISVTLPPVSEPSAVPQDIALDIVYEDEHLIVIDKPAGMVVHPAPGHPDGTLVNALLGHCTDLSGIGGTLRPGIVHRLDKDTSGVMVATKDDRTHTALAALFQRHELERAYLAVVGPPPRWLQGTWSTLYGRHPTQRKKFSSRVARGKPAITHYRVERVYGDGVAARVRCRLETGRTHQIRVHCADHGCAVIGDPVYGRRQRNPALAELARALGRQALHAAVLGFRHPITGETLRWQSPPPADMQTVIAALETLGR